MKKLSRTLSLFFIILFGIMSPLMAQGDHYENGGKLYAVVFCVSIILIGIIWFLFYLERRIKKMESADKY